MRGQKTPRPELRHEPRTRMIQRARVVFGTAVRDAAVLDLSSTGARLHLLRATEVPEQVQLHLPDGTTVTARRRWRQDEQIGFAFVAPPVAHQDRGSPGGPARGAQQRRSSSASQGHRPLRDGLSARAARLSGRLRSTGPSTGPGPADAGACPGYPPRWCR